MDLTVDPRQVATEPAGSLKPSDLRAAGFPVDIDGSLPGRGQGQDSFRAECECPDDCPRDHGNE